MNRKQLAAVSLHAALAVVLSTAFVTPAAAQVTGIEYTADMTFESTDGIFIAGKVYRAPHMERREMTIGSQQVVSIVRFDYDLVWIVVPAASVYTKTTLDDPLVRDYLPVPEVGEPRGRGRRRRGLGPARQSGPQGGRGMVEEPDRPAGHPLPAREAL